MVLQVLGHEPVQVAFVLDGRVERPARRRGPQLNPHAARVRPVLRVQLVRLEGDGELRAGGGPTGRLQGVDERARERVADCEGERDAPALGVRARRVEVDGVEGLVGFEGFFGRLWGAGWLRLEECRGCQGGVSWLL